MIEPPVHTGVDEVAAHPRHTGQHWLDMTLALSAVAISVISLFVAIAHGRTEEKLVAASSWPFVVANVTHNDLVQGAGIITLGVTNSGVGPARIQSARILLDGQPVRSRLELLARCCGFAGGDSRAQIRDGLRAENEIIGVLSPRQQVEVLSIEQTASTSVQWGRLGAIGPRLRLFACYCSVLNECWTTDLRPTADPQRVAKCQAGADDYTD